MSQITQDGEDAALGALTGGATAHVALSTTGADAATEAASGEIAGAGYARLPVAAWTKSDLESGARQWANSAELRWDFTGAVAGTVVSAQIWDALAGGNLLCAADLEAPVTGVVNGTRITLAAGDLAVTLGAA